MDPGRRLKVLGRLRHRYARLFVLSAGALRGSCPPAENETEISFFSRDLYEAFKQNPEVGYRPFLPLRLPGLNTGRNADQVGVLIAAGVVVIRKARILSHSLVSCPACGSVILYSIIAMQSYLYSEHGCVCVSDTRVK